MKQVNEKSENLSKLTGKIGVCFEGSHSVSERWSAKIRDRPGVRVRSFEEADETITINVV